MSRFKIFLILVILGALSIGWRSSGTVEPILTMPQNMSLQDTILLVSDRNTGVHVFDVKDPAAPLRKYVISLDGNRGSAMKGDILYADDWESLYAIRLEADTFTVVKTIVNFSYDDIMCGGVRDGRSGFGCACASDESGGMTAPSGASTGSSYATFAVIDPYLYYFNRGELVTMDISSPEDPAKPEVKSETPLPTPYGLALRYPLVYVSSGNTGFRLLNVSSPTKPAIVASWLNVDTKDFIWDGNILYVMGFEDIRLFDVSNPLSPVQLSRFK
jgi:hypothetical protein